ncbi:hypothetical protein GG344DRAFT_84061 [Lentinula edodes]|nr:hypothetical protein GG344DRAFT_84061 [Lentinula edodes]
MVFRHISRDLKERATWLLDHDNGIEEVAELLGVTERSIYRWMENIDTHGSVVAPNNYTQGRPSTLNSAMVHDLVALAEEAPELYLDEIQDWLAVAVTERQRRSD